MADDELEAVQAIYCQPGEVEVSPGNDNSKHVKVLIRSSTPNNTNLSSPPPVPIIQLDLRLFLSPSYPEDSPTISVLSNQLSRDELTHLRRLLSDTASENAGQPMLLEIISQATDELHKMMAEKQNSGRVKVKESAQCVGSDSFGDNSVDNSSVGDNSVGDISVGENTSFETETSERVCSDERTVLLHLDHMRAKNQYVKLIRKWTTELDLGGRLMFCQRLILILLQGPSSDIKEYIVRQRTNNVDVDSKGHPCKERMLSVVCDIATRPEFKKLTDFEVVEESSAVGLQQIFDSLGLGSMFKDQVHTLKHFPGKS